MRELLNGEFFTCIWRPIIMVFGSGLIIRMFPSSIFPQTKTINENYDPTPIALKVQQFTQNLGPPTDITFPNNGDVWVTKQTEKIPVIKNGKLLDVPLLDLQSKLMKLNGCYVERRLSCITLQTISQI